MHWRFKDWPAEMYSSVTLTFKDTGTSAEVTLSQVVNTSLSEPGCKS